LDPRQALFRSRGCPLGDCCASSVSLSFQRPYLLLKLFNLHLSFEVSLMRLSSVVKFPPCCDYLIARSLQGASPRTLGANVLGVIVPEELKTLCGGGIGSSGGGGTLQLLLQAIGVLKDFEHLRLANAGRAQE
jgi:hypothetical protein